MENKNNFAEIVIKFIVLIIKFIALIISGLGALMTISVGLIIISLTAFAIFGFIFFNFATDSNGRFLWDQPPSSPSLSEVLNDTYQECIDNSSFASMMFININTNNDKMQKCLETAATDNNYSDSKIMGLKIPTDFKKILIKANGANYTDALATAANTFHMGPILAHEYYRSCLRDTSFLRWGILYGFINRNKARECFIERHEDLFDGFTESQIKRMEFPGHIIFLESEWLNESNHEHLREIMTYINLPESQKLLEKKKEEFTQIEKIQKKCSINLQSYPTQLEVTDFTDSNYGGVYELDGIYNCSPKWTNFTCGQHGDGTYIPCYLFFSPKKYGDKKGTWVIQPLPPSKEWNAGAFYGCPGMPWEKCNPGWIGGKSVIIKK